MKPENRNYATDVSIHVPDSILQKGTSLRMGYRYLTLSETCRVFFHYLELGCIFTVWPYFSKLNSRPWEKMYNSIK